MPDAQVMSLGAGVKPPPASSDPADKAAEPAAELDKRLSEMLEKATSKINSDLRADFGRELKALKEAVGAVKPKSADLPEDSQTEKTLRERLTVLEERENKQRQNATRLAIRENLIKAGADPELAQMAVLQVLENEGQQFVVKEGKFGGYEVSFGDSAVSDWAKNFMASDTGKRIASSVSTPNLGLPGSAPTPKAKRSIPKSQLKTLSKEELDSGNIEIVDG